jgi:hypothetical protein
MTTKTIIDSTHKGWWFITTLVIAGVVLTEAAFAAQTPEIVLKQVQSGTWNVTYNLAHPAKRLEFVRVRDESRAQRWRPTDEQFELKHSADLDVITRKDEGSFSNVSFNIPATYIHVRKEYAPFSPFSDGGLLIHSGRYHVCAGEERRVACPKDDTGDEGPWRITISPPTGAHVILHGEVVNGPVTFFDTHDGTNIYVGPAIPLETEHFLAVIDSDLPKNIHEKLFTYLPQFIEYFSQRLHKLSNRPMLFVSRDPELRTSGYSSQGGTLPNQIFMHLYGEGWDKEPDPATAHFIPWFFAHEAAHLFQKSRVSDAGFGSNPWIHEGSADAFASLSIKKFDPEADEYVMTRVSNAFKDCVQELSKMSGDPINAADKHGAFDVYYSCGMLMNLAADSSVRRASKGEKDLFDIWKVFLEEIDSGAVYAQATYLSVIERMGDAGTAEFLRKFASDPQTDPRATLLSGLKSAGVNEDILDELNAVDSAGE